MRRAMVRAIRPRRWAFPWVRRRGGPECARRYGSTAAMAAVTAHPRRAEFRVSVATGRGGRALGLAPTGPRTAHQAGQPSLLISEDAVGVTESSGLVRARGLVCHQLRRGARYRPRYVVPARVGPSCAGECPAPNRADVAEAIPGTPIGGRPRPRLTASWSR
jgi:hypothetical protein